MSRKLTVWAAALYPRAWRERYGEEFRALLEDADPTLRDFFTVLGGALLMQLRSRTVWRTVGAMILAGAIMGAVLAYRAPSRFESSATVTMIPDAQPSSADRASGLLIEVRQVITNRTTLEGLILDHDLYLAERRSVPMEEVVSRMRERDLRFAWSHAKPPDGGSDVLALSVSFSYPDKVKAQQVVKELLARMADLSIRIGQPPRFVATSPAMPDERLWVLRAASAPEKREGRREFGWYVTAGTSCGILLALLFCRPKRTMQFAALAIAGGMLAVAPTYFMPNTWRSTAILRLSNGILLSGGQQPAISRLEALQTAALTDDYFQRLISAPYMGLYRSEQTRTPMPELIRRLRRDLSITPLAFPGEPQAAAANFAVSFNCADRNIAQSVVRHVVQALVEGNLNRAIGKQRSGQLFPAQVFDTLEVLDPPSDPQAPIGPNRYYFLLAGMGAGLLFGCWRLRRTPPPATGLAAADSTAPDCPRSGPDSFFSKLTRNNLFARFGAAGPAALLIAVALLSAITLRAQAQLRFDVISIKPVAGGRGPSNMVDLGFERAFAQDSRGGTFHVPNTTLHLLMELAYDVKDYQIANEPSWASSDGYEVMAKVEAHSNFEQMRPLLQSLLADRFRLKLRSETREQTIYELFIAKGGPKITPTAKDGCVVREAEGARLPLGSKICGGVRFGIGPSSTHHLEGFGVSAAKLAEVLSDQIGRPVADKTAFPEKFDFSLNFSPDDQAVSGDAASSREPSIFQAVEEQLGLRLQPAKAPVPMLVIEHVERPEAN